MSRIRRFSGSAIAEFGPALFVLLLMVFFPLLDLLGLAAGYYMSGIYHDYMIRELAISAPPGTTDTNIQSQAAAIHKINDNFECSTFFKFLGMKAGDEGVDSILYLTDPATQVQKVQCTTHTNVRPFISIPLWGNVPGLNAPFNFQMTSQRPQEETGRN